MQEKIYKEEHLDVLSALVTTEHVLKGNLLCTNNVFLILSNINCTVNLFLGPTTLQRLLVAKLALSASGLSLNNLNDIRSVIHRLELICTLQQAINRLCDCSFLYWHQNILSVYFSTLKDTKVDLSRSYVSIF